MWHPVRRTNPHGNPAHVDSPWMLLKISVTLKLRVSLLSCNVEICIHPLYRM